MSSYTLPLDEYENQIVGGSSSSNTSTSRRRPDQDDFTTHSDPGFTTATTTTTTTTTKQQKQPSTPKIRRRSGVELRMPAEIRSAMLQKEHTTADMKNAATAARKVQSQRRATYAFCEFESTQEVLESVQRKFTKLFSSRLQKKKTPLSPSSAWVQEYKQTKKAERKAALEERRKNRRTSVP